MFFILVFFVDLEIQQMSDKIKASKMFCSLTKIARNDSICRIYNANKPLSVVFSPRTWRCFSKRRADCYLNAVFSTHVEMFLIDDVLEDVKDIFSSRM